MKSEIREILLASVKKNYKKKSLDFDISRTKTKSHGNWSSNVALILGKELKQQPKIIAENLVKNLPKKKWLEKVEIAGPGFVNFFLTEEAQSFFLKNFLSNDLSSFKSKMPRKILIEYVSSNPTGPIHIGHGRGAAFGSALANLLRFTGDEVIEEYYINDRGLQTDVLALSVFLRYQELFKVKVDFPEECYQGDYIKECAFLAKEKFLDKYLAKKDLKFTDQSNPLDLINKIYIVFPKFSEFVDFCIHLQMDQIKGDLSKFKVHHNNWVSEKDLYKDSDDGSFFEKIIKVLKNNEFTYLQDEALWFKSKEFNDEKDRVLIRNNQDPTYFASDIAYHKFKFERDFDQLINVWGADHHGYIPRLNGALEALELDSNKLKTLIIQFVSLVRSGKNVSMSTRKGEFITLKELIDEVGVEATRFFFLARKSDQALEFDIDLAKKEDKNNPVYYIQYAHARICSLEKEVKKRKLIIDQNNGLDNLKLIAKENELDIINEIERFQDVLSQCRKDLEIHPLCFYLREIASKFHSYYNANKFIEDNKDLRDAKFALVFALKKVFQQGLEILSINAPEKM